MIYDETGYFLTLALKQSLRAAEMLPAKLPERKRSSLESKLRKFTHAIIDHMSGSARRPKPLHYFKNEAAKIERTADQISDENFVPIQIRLNPIFEEALRITEKPRKEDAYGYSLRAHYTRQRIALIQQVTGARLYPNNADLGSEFELCIRDYLEKNLGSDVKVTLGGYICDHEGNRSDQMDIIVTVADGLPFQPSDRIDGKSICLIEHVVAAITVKTKINKRKFKDCWENIQSIPRYTDLQKERPRFPESTPWPLCFAICETTDDLDSIKKPWTELVDQGEKPRHDFQILFSLTEGFLYPNSVCWPLKGFGQREHYNVMKVDGFRASVGLGWILLSIIARGAILAGKESHHFERIRNTLHYLSLEKGVPNTYDPKHDQTSWAYHEILGKLKTGNRARNISNSRFVISLEYEDQVYFNLARPNPNREAGRSNKIFGNEPHEPRYFRQYLWQIQGDRVLLQEWRKNKDGTYSNSPAAFCSTSGREIEVPFETYSEASKNVKLLPLWPFLEES